MMADSVWIPVWVVVISTLPQIIAAITSAVNSIRLSKLSKNMDALEKNTNHKMDQLLEVTKTSAHAEGKLEGKAEGVATVEIRPSLIVTTEKDKEKNNERT